MEKTQKIISRGGEKVFKVTRTELHHVYESEQDLDRQIANLETAILKFQNLVDELQAKKAELKDTPIEQVEVEEIRIDEVPEEVPVIGGEEQ